MGIPIRAAPMAKESQYFAAINVEPRAPVIIGILHLVLTSLPNAVSIFTLGNMQSSGELERPLGRPYAP